MFTIHSHFLLLFKCTNSYLKACFITVLCSKLYNRHFSFDVHESLPSVPSCRMA